MTQPELFRDPNKWAVFSPCRKWRYELWRRWDFERRYMMVIGLNPSTADELTDDPTVRRCIGFAKLWGFGGLAMTNIFAWRDTLPANMKKAPEPIGEKNDETLQRIAAGAGMILAAWGSHGKHLDRGEAVLKMIPNVHYLKLNADGSPQHPLYIPYSTVPLPFEKK